MGRVSRKSRSAAPGAGRYARDRDDEDFEKDDKDEDFDEPRRSRRSRARDDEEEKDEPRRSRRSRRDEEEEEDETPRRSRRRSSRDDDDDDRGDDIGSGWDSWDQKPKGSGGGNFPDRLSLDEDGASAVFKFGQDQPFAVYRRHWVGGRSYTCLEQVCPLCDAGDTPTTRAAFNVIVFLIDEDGDGDYKEFDPPEVMVYDAAPTVAKKLKGYHEDTRKGPLTRHYWEITCEKAKGKGGKGFTKQDFAHIKERDVEEDFDFLPLTEEELEEVEEDFWTKKEYPYIPKEDDLEEAADAVSSRDYDDDDRDSRPRGRKKKGRTRR